MNKYLFIVAISSFVMMVLFAFFGILYVDRFEEEGYMEFFVKAKPSLFITAFTDPYATDLYGYIEDGRYKQKQDENGMWLPGTEEFREFSSYCWHRYGISQVSQADKRVECQIMSKEHHNTRWPYAPDQFLFWNMLVPVGWQLHWQSHPPEIPFEKSTGADNSQSKK